MFDTGFSFDGSFQQTSGRMLCDHDLSWRRSKWYWVERTSSTKLNWSRLTTTTFNAALTISRLADVQHWQTRNDKVIKISIQGVVKTNVNVCFLWQAVKTQIRHCKLCLPMFRDIRQVMKWQNHLDEEEYKKLNFVDERPELCTKTVTEILPKHKLSLFSRPVVKTVQTEETLAALHCGLFSRLYISCQTRDGCVDQFVSHENHRAQPALTWELEANRVLGWNQMGNTVWNQTWPKTVM